MGGPDGRRSRATGQGRFILNELVLRLSQSFQPVAFEPAPVAKEPVAEADLEAEELAIAEDEEPSADDEVDLATGDDGLGVETPGDDDEA